MVAPADISTGKPAAMVVAPAEVPAVMVMAAAVVEG